MAEEKVDRKTLEILLDAKISPLVDAIEDVKKVQETIVEVLQSLARQDEKIRHLEEGEKEHDRVHTDIYNRIRGCENKTTEEVGKCKGDSSKKTWGYLKILLTAIASGGFVTLLHRVFG